MKSPVKFRGGAQRLFVATRCLVVACSCCALVAFVRGDEPDRKTLRDEQMKHVNDVLAQFKPLEHADGKPLKQSPKPALSYTNPVREGDFGATFFYLDGPTPVAVVAASVRGSKKVFAEFSMIQDRRIVVSHDQLRTWTPESNGRAWETVAKVAAPSERDTARLVQMRAIARSFSVRILRDEPVNCRLLSQPLLRYADKSRGVVDAACFAFVEATDPEVLVVIEAREDDEGQRRWMFTLTRCTSQQVAVTRKGEIIWEVGKFWKGPKLPTEPYQERYVGSYDPQ